MFCALLGQDQVSSYRTIDPLVLFNIQGGPYVLNKMIKMCTFKSSENTDNKEVDQTVQFWLIMPLPVINWQ